MTAFPDNRVVIVATVLTVGEIWRYPVKSMGGERLERASVGETGIVGDRAWGVRDVLTGMILTGRREPKLLMASASLHDGVPVIEIDFGRQLTTSEELSAWLDRPVELVPAGQTPGTFENPLDIDHEDDWTSWQGPIGSFHDGSGCVSLASFTTMAGYEAQRFRLNLILERAEADCDEAELIGHDVTIGSVGFHIGNQIDRCVMVARAQPGLAADLSVLKRLIRERYNHMGISASVYREGALSVGEAIHPLPD